MNERIQQLKEQARDFYLLQEDLDCLTKQLHELVDAKFAELIVAECADVCESFGESGDGYTCSAVIKEHFGVEE